jgi:hypothetical protein
MWASSPRVPGPVKTGCQSTRKPNEFNRFSSKQRP